MKHRNQQSRHLLHQWLTQNTHNTTKPLSWQNGQLKKVNFYYIWNVSHLWPMRWLLNVSPSFWIRANILHIHTNARLHCGWMTFCLKATTLPLLHPPGDPGQPLLLCKSQSHQSTTQARIPQRRRHHEQLLTDSSIRRKDGTSLIGNRQSRQTNEARLDG